MIPRDKISNADRIKGTVVKMQDADYEFFDTYLLMPWWMVWKRVKRLIFRIPVGTRLYHDRYNDFWVNDRNELKIPNGSRYIINVPSTEENIQIWMEAHYWTFQQKGFPKDNKWLKSINWEEYDKQTEKAFGKEAKLKRIKKYKINRKTLKVSKI